MSNRNKRSNLNLPKPPSVKLLVELASHWTFQSLFYMDHTERWFKLLLDVVLTLGLGMLLALWWAWPLALIVAFLLAHTLNFLFNAQMCALGANYGWVHTSHEELVAYAHALGQRAEQEPAIQSAAFCGSLAQASWHEESDLDVRILRRPGFVNGLRAAWFVLLERSRAQFAWFPLDIYLFDSTEAMQGKLRASETLTYFSTAK